MKCRNCGSANVVSGRIIEYQGYQPVFRPSSMRFFSFSITGGLKLERESWACRDCGFVAAQLDKDKLERFLGRHCDEPLKPS